MSDREHVPCRPGWGCWSCGDPWPCEPARAELAQQLNPVALVEFMGKRMHEAASDDPTRRPEELVERFLRWTLRPGP